MSVVRDASGYLKSLSLELLDVTHGMALRLTRTRLGILGVSGQVNWECAESELVSELAVIHTDSQSAILAILLFQFYVTKLYFFPPVMYDYLS